jgi:hypothetical protein
MSEPSTVFPFAAGMRSVRHAHLTRQPLRDEVEDEEDDAGMK